MGGHNSWDRIISGVWGDSSEKAVSEKRLKGSDRGLREEPREWQKQVNTERRKPSVPLQEISHRLLPTPQCAAPVSEIEMIPTRW